MRSRFHFLHATLISLLSMATCFGGEKIQFSAPSEKAEAAPKTRDLSKSSGNLLNSLDRSPDFAAPPAMSTAPVQGGDRNKKKEKDWVFGKPDEAPSMNELFKPQEEKNEKVDSKSNNLTSEKSSEFDSSSSASDKSDSGFSSLRDTRSKTDSEFRPKWEQNSSGSFNEKKLSDGQSGALADFFRGKENERDRFANRDFERRGEFQQIFQSRPTETTSSLIDKTREQVNPTIGLNDSLSAPEWSFSQSWRDSGSQLSGGRFSAQDDLNSRSVVRNNSALESKQDFRAKAQPAVLPMPNRPGQIFKQPGSY